MPLRVRDVVGDDLLGQALDDGGLAHAGLADEHRVVLGAPRQDLHDPLDLFLAADDGVKLAFTGRLGQVATELVEDERRRRGTLGGAACRGGLLALVAREQLDDLLADPVEVGTELHQHLRRNALALADEAEQDVLGADVVVPELERLAKRQLQDLLRTRRERDVPAGCLLALADDLLHLGTDGLERDAQALQCLGGDTLTLVNHPEQNVLGADVIVIEEPGLFLSENHDPSGPVREPFKHGAAPP